MATDAGGRLSELGEFAFLERLRALPSADRDVDLGIGDDCAIVRAGGRRWLLTTDALVEGVHFRWRWDDPAGHGRRAFAFDREARALERQHAVSRPIQIGLNRGSARSRLQLLGARDGDRRCEQTPRIRAAY